MSYFEKLSISGNIPPSQSSNYVDSQAVQDLSTVEGVSQIQLLSLILLELRILNQQMYELPGLIAQGLSSQDPPESFRNEQSAFNI
jgi:hypothetical protein